MLKIAFICIHNSCRSIMAEGFAKHYGKGIIDSYSAGTEVYPGPKQMALEVMTDAGVDMSHASSKLISDIPEADIVITMGCGVECPYLTCSYREDWGLTDPSGGTKFDFEITRELIRTRVLELIERVQSGQFVK